MFITGIKAIVKGFTGGEPVGRLAPDGREITEISVAVGDGSKKFPKQWVKIVVWEELADVALKYFGGTKGIAVEAEGWLLSYTYKYGTEVKLNQVLRGVHELRIYDKDSGKLKEVLSGVAKEE